MQPLLKIATVVSIATLLGSIATLLGNITTDGLGGDVIAGTGARGAGVAAGVDKVEQGLHEAGNLFGLVLRGDDTITTLLSDMFDLIDGAIATFSVGDSDNSLLLLLDGGLGLEVTTANTTGVAIIGSRGSADDEKSSRAKHHHF